MRLKRKYRFTKIGQDNFLYKHNLSVNINKSKRLRFRQIRPTEVNRKRLKSQLFSKNNINDQKPIK
jgi:hypothetical protein